MILKSILLQFATVTARSLPCVKFPDFQAPRWPPVPPVGFRSLPLTYWSFGCYIGKRGRLTGQVWHCCGNECSLALGCFSRVASARAAHGSLRWTPSMVGADSAGSTVQQWLPSAVGGSDGAARQPSRYLCWCYCHGALPSVNGSSSPSLSHCYLLGVTSW